MNELLLTQCLSSSPQNNVSAAKGKKEEQQLSLRDRMALFQTSPPVRPTSIKKSSECKKKNGNTSLSRSLGVQTETKGYKACSSSSLSNAHLNEAPSSTSFLPPTDTCQSQDLTSFLLPSYCDFLFSSLSSLKEEGLLLDCSLQLLGNTYKAHQLVLAAVSQKATEWLCSKNIEVNLHHLENTGCDITYAGLNAVLNFAYCGEVNTIYSEARDLEEIRMACRGLEVDRLAEVCKAKDLATRRAEKEQRLQVIRTLWKRRIGCDVIMKVESGERFPGNDGYFLKQKKM